MNLEEIIESYENLRKSYRNQVNSEHNRDTLIEYQSRFTDLKAELRNIHSKVTYHYSLHDDKSATAKKYKLCIEISEGRLTDENKNPIYPICSINQAEKYASGCPEYIEFIKKRAFWKESLANVNNIREDINSYLIEISNRLK